MELNKLCRTCLSVCDDMKSLYETSATTTEICCAEMLSSFTPLICFQNDGYPTTICQNCMGDLNQCYAFRLKCLESAEMLRNHAEKVIGIANSVSENTDNATVQNYTTTTKLLNTPMQMAEMRKDLDHKLDLINNVIHVKVEMEDELNVAHDYKINSQTSPQEIISVSAVFNNLRNQTHCEDNSTICATLHCTDVTNAQSYVTTALQVQDLDLIQFEKDNRVFEEVSIKCEASQSPGIGIIEENLDSKLFSQGIKIQKCNLAAKSLKDPLTIAEIQKDIDQTLDIIKHEVDVNITKEKEPVNKQEKGKPYACTVCNKAYTRNTTLKFHMSKHTGEKPHSCTICDRTFSTKYYLTSHMRSHTGEKPYTCTVCNRSFYTKQHLCDHARSHTGEKPYSCTVCDRSFYTRQHLRYHTRSHTGETPYACTVCDSSFASKHNLVGHMWTHTGQKPYPCTVCDSAFHTKQRLITHERTHKRVKSRTRTVCDNSVGLHL